MDALHTFLVILHLLGMAGVVGGFLAVVKEPRVIPAMVHGALTQVITGLALVGLAEIRGGDVDHVKIAVKLLLALVVVGAVLVGKKAEGARAATCARTAGALGLTAVIVAVVM